MHPDPSPCSNKPPPSDADSPRHLVNTQLFLERRMKRIPFAVAAITLTFLAVCFLQVRGRGIGFVPPPTDWELHAAWWHFDFLADCGEYLVVFPAFYLVLLFVSALERFGLGASEMLSTAVWWLAIGLPIAIESLLVFYLTRVCVSYISRRRQSTPTKAV